MSIAASLPWQQLKTHAETIHKLSSAELFRRDAGRLKKYDLRLGGLRLNYAFQRVDDRTLTLLADLARAANLEDWRSRMGRGETINSTEKRAVLHTALRRPHDQPLPIDGVDIMPEISAAQIRLAAFVAQVRSGGWRGATGKQIRHIVNIGIGGSDLGPRLAVTALKPFASALTSHFIANIDAWDSESVLRHIDPAESLFVIVSKSFTTQETLLNAQTARRWLTEHLGAAAVARHFVAVSTNAAEVHKFGIAPENMFPIWDWVGGRFSLWSAVGLSLNLAIGNERFADMLAGAAAMDAHFEQAPLSANMPALLALLGIWNRNFLRMPALAILPYSERLRDLPRYLQQLEMESNGKAVTRDGLNADYATAPALFGECGSVGQHSFHQWLHQGTTPIAADFIGIKQDDVGENEHHRLLLSHLAAQMGALAFGQEQAASLRDVYPGGRPSNLLMLDRLDPYHFGMLLALYEHKTFVQGVIWNINSFDQPGVELGKRIATQLAAAASGEGLAPTQALLRDFYRSLLS